MKHHAFLTCHPAVNLLYFVLVLTFSMFFLHPLCLVVSLCAALWCAAQLNGGTAVRRTALWLAPTALLAALFAGEVLDVSSDIAVLSLGGKVKATSVRVAGNHYDEEILKFVRNKFSIAIGQRTAENLKKNVACCPQNVFYCSFEYKNNIFVISK